MRNFIYAGLGLLTLSVSQSSAGAAASTLACNIESTKNAVSSDLDSKLCAKVALALGLDVASSTSSDFNLNITFENKYSAAYKLSRTNDNDVVAEGKLDVMDAPLEMALLSHLPMALSKKLGKL